MRKDSNVSPRAGDRIVPYPSNELEKERLELARDLAMLIRRKLRRDAMVAAIGSPVPTNENAPATETKAR